jgi:hypothetical protein
METKPKAGMPQPQPSLLRDALRHARIEVAERSAVIVDLYDAEIARLELLNDALDPLFAEIPAAIEFFDRGISRGDLPRLWIDMIAHVAMGRDRRVYRFIQDTRNGPKVLAESPSADDIVQAVTKYVARRMIERERALANDERVPVRRVPLLRQRRFWRGVRTLVLGAILGVGAVLAAAWIVAGRI